MQEVQQWGAFHFLPSLFLPSSLNFLPQFVIASDERRYREWERKNCFNPWGTSGAGPARGMWYMCGLKLAHNVLTFLIWNKITRRWESGRSEFVSGVDHLVLVTAHTEWTVLPLCLRRMTWPQFAQHSVAVCTLPTPTQVHRTRCKWSQWTASSV